MVERALWERVVAGSSPVTRTDIFAGMRVNRLGCLGAVIILLVGSLLVLIKSDWSWLWIACVLALLCAFRK